MWSSNLGHLWLHIPYLIVFLHGCRYAHIVYNYYILSACLTNGSTADTRRYSPKRCFLCIDDGVFFLIQTTILVYVCMYRDSERLLLLDFLENCASYRCGVRASSLRIMMWKTSSFHNFVSRIKRHKFREPRYVTVMNWIPLFLLRNLIRRLKFSNIKFCYFLLKSVNGMKRKPSLRLPL